MYLCVPDTLVKIAKRPSIDFIITNNSSYVYLL